MTPTFDRASTFNAQYKRLGKPEKEAFRKAVAKFVEDLLSKKGFRKSLRVKNYQWIDGVFEMTWAPNGRALFAFGDEIRPGEIHVIWLQIGGHEIFK
jgi:hypothetical protein